MLLCFITRCRISMHCIDKNVSLSVVCKSPANGGRFTRIALETSEFWGVAETVAIRSLVQLLVEKYL